MGLAALPKDTWSSPAFLQQQLDTPRDLHPLGHPFGHLNQTPGGSSREQSPFLGSTAKTTGFPAAVQKPFRKPEWHHLPQHEFLARKRHFLTGVRQLTCRSTAFPPCCRKAECARAAGFSPPRGLCRTLAINQRLLQSCLFSHVASHS